MLFNLLKKIKNNEKKEVHSEPIVTCSNCGTIIKDKEAVRCPQCNSIIIGGHQCMGCGKCKNR